VPILSHFKALKLKNSPASGVAPPDPLKSYKTLKLCPPCMSGIESPVLSGSTPHLLKELVAMEELDGINWID